MQNNIDDKIIHLLMKQQGNISKEEFRLEIKTLNNQIDY